jgi:hypothetical protein
MFRSKRRGYQELQRSNYTVYRPISVLNLHISEFVGHNLNFRIVDTFVSVNTQQSFIQNLLACNLT